MDVRSPDATVTPTDDLIQDLQKQLERRERHLLAIARLTAALYTRTNLDDLQRQALHTAIDTVGASAGSIILHDPATNKLVFKYVVSPSKEITQRLTGYAMDVDQGICGSVFRAGQGRITGDVAADQQHHTETDRHSGYTTRNIVTVPLKTMDGRAIGVMQILNKVAQEFDEADLELLEILAAQAASAIETARLHEQAKVAQIVNLIGDISHDIKNMVTPVVTGAQTLELMLQGMFEDLDAGLAGAATAEAAAERVRTACLAVREFYPEAMMMTYEGAQAAQDRVREIADAIKGVVSEPHFEVADVNEVVESVIKPLRLVADRAGVKLDTTGLGEATRAEIDRKRMYNALYNLINNAIPETPAGGRVSVRTALAEQEGEPGLQIVVADTGRGMPEHIRARVFTDQAVSTKPGGTGLGTRIVKNVVDAHHGTILVASQEGKGTTFTIWIPQKQPEVA
ncbi:MAG: GAF domain-containing sensor histidine kinase [Armatimonadetes bacterium]|nr:GAF domain-containing sensor histidine kinase [Armatimonadota bacterium]